MKEQDVIKTLETKGYKYIKTHTNSDGQHILFLEHTTPKSCGCNKFKIGDVMTVSYDQD